MELLRTPLYEEHIKCGGKMVPFAGYELPVQYATGVIHEHMAVRTACGIFDVSHMGEIICSGEDALANINMLLTNNYTDLQDNHARYSPMCNENGGVVDDLIVYKKQDNEYFIVVNAANKDKDFNWMKDHAFGKVEFKDVSAEYAQIALQGPNSETVLAHLTKDIPAKYYTCIFGAKIDDIDCIISRTGYTGEDGFEIYVESRYAAAIWNMLLENGSEEGLIPCGLGARDTLRLEAAMPLYGHEMNDEISPKEAGLGIFVKMDKDDFIGKKALEEKGVPKRRRVGLKVTGRGIIREAQDVFVGDKKIGVTTSGTHCPYLKQAVALALVDTDYKDIGTKVQVNVRGRMVDAEVIKLPFYKRSK